MNFENLSPDWLASAVRLSTQAGWNQTPEDWHRLIRLAPNGVKVWIADGEVRASYSIFGLGSRVAWLGMVLVDRDFRGRGLGKTLFAHALQEAGDGGQEVLGLDATELGEPIYRKSGFETVVPIVRWQGMLSPGLATTPSPGFRSGFTPAVVDLDRRLLGEDRSALLADLAGHDGTFFRLEQGEELLAYAVLRPGRTASHLGPVVATTAENFTEILAGIAHTFPGREIVCDLLDPTASATLSGFGLSPLRTLKRMTRPRQDRCLNGAGIWCAPGFEWG